MSNPNESSITTAAGGVNNSSSSSGTNVLSEKVNRALAIRTDTPAMKAALDALANLESSTTDNTNDKSPPKQPTTTTVKTTKTTKTTTTTTIDSRSVRVAIEQDALQQALHLQSALQSIVSTVQELRMGISEIAAIAQQVRTAAHTNVVVVASTTKSKSTTTSTTTPTEESKSNKENDHHSNNHDNYDEEEEQKLAAVLMDAFSHRDLARKRLQAVHEFMEKFDLSERDSYLLDQYAFEDASHNSSHHYHNHRNEEHDDDENNTNNDNNDEYTTSDGMAFLKALERVKNIRLALQQTFGGGGHSGSDAAQHILGVGGSSSDDDRNSKGSLGANSALRMMESLAQKQERAYERLYHWLQSHLQLFPKQHANDYTNNNNNNNNTQEADDNDGAYLDEALQEPFVRRALYTLRHVPAFYCHTLELISSSRRSEVTRRFLLALTSGYAHMPPIEMKAHDSVAYVGDMLAFSFKAFSVEADVARGLLEFQPADQQQQQQAEQQSNEKEDEKQQQQQNSEDNDESEVQFEEYSSFSSEKAMGPRDMLSISMSGLARPLKSRILQVISTLARRPGAEQQYSSHHHHHNVGLVDDDDDEDDMDDDDMDDEFGEEGAVVRSKTTQLYEISGLLLFYISVMQKSIDKLSTTTTTTKNSNIDDNNKNNNNKNNNAKSNPLVACLLECLQEATTSYEATLRVYGAMLDQLSVMTGESEAILVHSMLTRLAEVRLNSPGYASDIECPVEQCRVILSIEWVTQTLVESSLNKCTTLDDAMSLKQSVAAAKKAGMKLSAAEKLDEEIEQKESAMIDELVVFETTQVLDMCGLGSLATAWNEWQEGGVASSSTMSSYPGLSPEDVEAGMKDFYASLYSPPLPSLETTVKDPLARRQARSKIAGKVSDMYAKLYQSITGPTGGYSDTSFLGHNPDQVKTLFSA